MILIEEQANQEGILRYYNKQHDSLTQEDCQLKTDNTRFSAFRYFAGGNHKNQSIKLSVDLIVLIRKNKTNCYTMYV